MPKKHRKFKLIKPEASVHHSLASSSSRRRNDPSRSEQLSVNDLIQHLRRTQLSTVEPQNVVGATEVVAKSVHPSIRNILDLPAPPPPRPRSGLRPQIGTRRLRRTPGPAAPLSWLSQNHERPVNDESRSAGYHGEVQRHLDRLPGLNFPPERSLQHTILKTMASNWDWHLVYDGIFLSELPTQVRQLLLSYIAVYTDHATMGAGMQGLKPLFLDKTPDGEVESHPDVIRLDLSGALGHWITLKLLVRELKYELPELKREDAYVPASWEEEASDEASSSRTGLTTRQPFLPRFEKLKYLSLAQPAPAAANWGSLLHLLSQLATLTHLSLAHWPVPTLSISTVVKHGPSTTFEQRLSPSDDDMSEAATVLGKLSRATYCLQWLDLEGCTEWLPSLCWSRENQHASLGQPLGPEWNGSWRGIAWLGLGFGWAKEVPGPEDDLISNENMQQEEHSLGHGEAGTRRVTLRPGQDLLAIDNAHGHGQAIQKGSRLRWQEKMWHLHVAKAKNIGRSIQNLRSEDKGKWIEVSVGDAKPFST
ncbi:hypothetical protein CPC735_065370 [Coccidioides posadasii C735 delta SOWgp]|uniref:Tafazzin n=1 Tax=Coccidioides posadasii (strain C735) TaxID=222929 RepID=C5PBW0_COCP7|nr:hypothetical protein CPC735_065370 [Coccidioides posadasii C735 delta SOWgp]EER25437.1 hypothetical protein CPC735_065370 [Coccidioides posadasii C735 delta SOWgp]|eukprot:XP_003067582.1 hypothetical protein CPC735_065370 [Coccidioides posadasii C735 delta SOWgp]